MSNPELRDDVCKPPLQGEETDRPSTAKQEDVDDVDKEEVRVEPVGGDGDKNVGEPPSTGTQSLPASPPLPPPPPPPPAVPLTTKPAPPSHTRHILPQIPTMSHSRLAVSKASRKENQGTTAPQPVVNLVSQAELEEPAPPKPNTDNSDDGKADETAEETGKATEENTETPKDPDETVTEEKVEEKTPEGDNKEVEKDVKNVVEDKVETNSTDTSETPVKENSSTTNTTKTGSKRKESTKKDGSSESSSKSKRERKSKQSETKTPTKKKDVATDSANPPANIPTPPSEDPSPKLSAQQSPTSGSPPTPIKLKIKRNTGSGLTSTVTIGEEMTGESIQVQGQQGSKKTGAPPSGEKRQTRTKALLKGKSLRQKLSRACTEPEEPPPAPPPDVPALEVPEPTEEALKAAIIDPSVEPAYNVGDMLWAKVGGHPFWACMVSHDPFDGLYYKQRKKKKVPTATLR